MEIEEPARNKAQGDTDQENKDISISSKTTPSHTSLESETTEVTPSVDHPSSCFDFISRQRYDNFAKRLPHFEKGFDEYCINKIPSVANIVSFFGWEKLCAIPAPSNLTWVREFYTSASMTESTEIIVRGHHVSYSPKAINSYFGLNPPVHSEFSRLINAPTDEDLEDVFDTVAQLGTTWRHYSKLQRKAFPTNRLSFDAFLWFNYLSHSLIPTTNDSYVCLDRMKLLHCIMGKQTVNVGMVISTMIAICSKRRARKLFFPALISGLMREVGVRKMKDDEIVNEKFSIDMLAVERIRSRYKSVNVTKSQPPSSPPPPPSDELVTLLKGIMEEQGEILGKLKVLEERMEKQEEIRVKAEKKRKRRKDESLMPKFWSSNLM